jgi:hypothetical protein
MKIVESASGMIRVELSRRNLEVLLAKLDEPGSICSILSPCRTAIIVAVDNDEHYSDRNPGVMLVGGSFI